MTDTTATTSSAHAVAPAVIRRTHLARPITVPRVVFVKMRARMSFLGVINTATLAHLV